MQTTLKLDATPEQPEEAHPDAPEAEPTISPTALIIEGEVTEIIPPKRREPPYYLLPIVTALFCLIFIAIQNLLPFFTSTVTIYITPKVQQITVSGLLQLGRVLDPITISQQRTVLASGHGHQNAERATGTITFYNGLFSSQTVARGTILTGSDGVQIITQEEAVIPAANPPYIGQVTISAHAIRPGVQGNIPTRDIDTQCCLTAVKAENTTAFTGGEDERDFQIVTKNDIITASATLKSTLTQSMPGALQGQLSNGELLQMVPCSPITTSDHAPEEEAATVTVMVSLTCSAIAYNQHTLREKVTQLQTIQAARKLGAGYTLAGSVHIYVHPLHTQPVVVTFFSTGTWVYALNSQVQLHIKSLISGKNTSAALQMLRTFPGIASATISAEDYVPIDLKHIHIVVIYTT